MGRRLRFALEGARSFFNLLLILGHSSYWDFAWDNRSDRTDLAVVVVVVVVANLNSSWKETERDTHIAALTPCVCVCVLKGFLGGFSTVGFGVPRELGERNHRHGGAA